MFVGFLLLEDHAKYDEKVLLEWEKVIKIVKKKEFFIFPY